MWVIPEDLGNFSPKKGEKSWGAPLTLQTLRPKKTFKEVIIKF
jgi:hypothetical protein